MWMTFDGATENYRLSCTNVLTALAVRGLLRLENVPR